MEQIDIFDENFKYLDSSVSIDEIHQKGLWHQTFACWVYNPNKKVIYLQLRGPKNRIGAGTFDASASGHLSANETKEDGFREVYEELGISATANEAEYLGTYKNIFYSQNYINNEFCHIFILKTDNSLKDFILQDGEVKDIYELKTSDIDNLLLKNTIEIKSSKENRKIDISNFCLYQERLKNGYYKKVFEQIKQNVKERE